MKMQGRAWKIDRDVAATDIMPARYDKLGMKRNWAECARHLLEDINSDFAAGVRPGDFLIVDGNLGSGHAHYFGAAVMSCREVQLSSVLARSINGMFFRSATDLGLKTWAFPNLVSAVSDGDELLLDLVSGEATNATRGTTTTLAPIPPLIIDVFEAGGTTNWAMTRPDVRERAAAYARGQRDLQQVGEPGHEFDGSTEA